MPAANLPNRKRKRNKKAHNPSATSSLIERLTLTNVMRSQSPMTISDPDFLETLQRFHGAVLN
ncbi:MAG: hypothetical protein HY298_26635 [Verrucomicrobia bacterium]|nr:hypothetical protein [Verrucomicrobiota bacterium]